MKRCRTQFFALLTIVAAASTVTSQPRPKTVVDYYKILPERYFEADRNQRINWMLDPERGAIVDVKRGFLYAPGDGAQSDLYVVLFLRRGHGDVIAVKHYAPDTQDWTYLDIYVFGKRHLVEVTKSVLPVHINNNLKYEFLRGRQLIRVRNEKGARLYDLVWSGSKFRLHY
jgi:hypothetical protein